MTTANVVGYIRVSSEQQAEGGVSLAAQKAKIEAYCVAMDLTLVGIEADEGISAKSLERPGLKRALGMLGAGAVGIVVVKLDRLTRSVKDLATLIDDYFRVHSLLSVGDSIDTRTAAGRMVLNILTSVAQWEREACGERTRDALAQVKREGGRIGQVGLGYRRTGQLDAAGRQIVEQVPEELATVERIRTWKIEGHTVRDIARKLSQGGYPTKKGGKWSKTQVQRIITKEFNHERHV